ncbi:NAD-dependent epimerase/dehydratase family protein [[Pseudomonas] boreopolis]|uniref:NAD-dependent epimerase/dehydratase family protein n=1 Tax=Xanthomonas boreopolis TaxID=86183 RepID=UPI003DA04618
MIIGNGLLARAFSSSFGDSPEVLIYAAGVSNSTETRLEEFSREEEQLRRQLEGFAGKYFVYFGSCGVANDESSLSPYLRHKLRMEQIVTNCSGGVVFRLPQVVGKTANPNTLTNYLNRKVSGGDAFNIWLRAERNLIDIDHVCAISSHLLANGLVDQQVVNIASENAVRVSDIVGILERIHGKRANYTLVDKGDPLKIEASLSWAAARELGIDLGTGYAERLIWKYYAL